MKQIFYTLLIAITTISMGFAQEQQEGVKSEHENKNDSAAVYQKIPESKSFTLDASDAKLEEKVVLDSGKNNNQKINDHYSVRKAERQRKQEEIETLAGPNTYHGGYGAVSIVATQFNDKDIMLLGFKGAWVINRVLGIGLEGYGIIPIAEYDNIGTSFSTNSRAVGGYGGLFLEPILMSNKVVHVTLPVSGGAGWVGYVEDWEDNYYTQNDLIDGDVFWYIQPGANLEVNVARNFRVDLGAYYRLTQDLHLLNTPGSAFDGWNYYLTLKFGKF